jgi:hypothetical protein
MVSGAENVTRHHCHLYLPISLLLSKENEVHEQQSYKPGHPPSADWMMDETHTNGSWGNFAIT